jgi:hypothetical protein
VTRTKKLLLRLVAPGALLLLLALGIVLTAPLWINRSTVKLQILRRLSQATGGVAEYERLQVRFLPLPGVVAARPRLSLAGMVEIQAESIAVDFRVLPLVTGRVQPHIIRVTAPRVSLRLPESKPLRLREAEDALRAALDGIAQAAPDLLATVEDGQVELRAGARPPLYLQQIQARLAVSADGIDAMASCGSNLWERLAVDLRLAREDLRGDGRAVLSGLQAARLGAVLGLVEGWPVKEAEVGARLSWRMRGLADLQAEGTASAPKVRLQVGPRRLSVRGTVLEMAAQLNGGTAEVTLRHLALESPRLTLKGRLVRNETGAYTLEAEAGEVDLVSVQAAARRLAPAGTWLARSPVRLEGGTLTALKVSSRGRTVAELIAPRALTARAAVRDVDLLIPEFGIRLHEVRGNASIDRGVVQVQQLGARLDKSIARDGLLVARLGVEPVPLHAEATLALDLSEVLALAKRVLRDPHVRRRLEQIEQLEGSAVARITLGESLGELRPRVEVSALSASARSGAVPFPVSLSGGRLTYADGALSVQRMDGAIGHSSFAGLSARLGLEAPYPLRVQGGSAVLALEELFRFLAGTTKLAEQLKGVDAVSGGLALSVSQLEGPLTSPQDWRFRVSLTPRHVVLDAPRFGPPVEFDGGVIGLWPRRIDVTGVRASALDTSLEVSGNTDDYREGLNHVQATFKGTVGQDGLKWIYARAGLPEEWRLRGPLLVSEAGGDWQKGGSFTAHGRGRVVNGPEVGFGLRHSQKRLEIENLTVRDDASDASLDGTVEGRHLEGRFKGRLAGTSIERIFAESLVSLGELRGDLRLEADLDHPENSTATGDLQGSKVRLPLEFPVPLTIDTFALEGKGNTVVVTSAILSSENSRVEIRGSATREQNTFVVDADVRGDEVVFHVPTARPETSGAQGGGGQDEPPEVSTLWGIPVAGRIGVDIGHLHLGRLDVAPLRAEGVFANRQLEVRLHRAALCGMTALGGMRARPGEADLDVTLSVRDEELGQLLACLTEGRIRMTGRLDLDAHLAASGEAGSLAKEVHGDFSMTARDGHIERFDILARIFELLNVMEVVHGKLPDLTQGGMGYNWVRARGRIAGRQIDFDEATLDADAATIAAQGRVDYATDQVDVTALVAPLQTVNWVLSNMPLLGRILGKPIVALPVRVGGTVQKPVVSLLSPGAISAHILDIMSGILKLPAGLITTVLPEGSGNKLPPGAKQDGP